MSKTKLRRLAWHGCTVFVLIALAWGLAHVTRRINYQWTWYRVPQYFIFHGEEAIFAPFDGVVRVEQGNPVTRLTLEHPGAEPSVMELSSLAPTVRNGGLVREGDRLGARRVTRSGLLLNGLLVTLQLSVLSGMLSMVFGLAAGLARTARNPTLRTLSTLYVEAIRGTPLLVQIFIFYFFLGTVLQLTRMTAGVLALAVFAGAYVAEIVRAGVQSIGRGQMEAARSLGMGYLAAMRHVILPQAVQRVLPALAGQFISLVKDSSLVSVIAITDLTKAGREVISNTFATFEIWFTVALLYLVLTFALSLLARYVERRLSVGEQV